MTDIEKKTLLLVEDDFLIAMAEKMYLEKYGYAVLVASIGETALESIKDNPGIDLVLMDIVEKTEKITSHGYVVKDSTISVFDASIKMAFKLFEAKTRAVQAALAALRCTLDSYVGKTPRELGYTEGQCVLCEDAIGTVF